MSITSERRRTKRANRHHLQTAIANKMFYTADVGSNAVTVRNASTGEIKVLTKEEFIGLNGIESGWVLFIEGAHLRARNVLSLSHALEFEELQQFASNAQGKNVLIYRFNQDQSAAVRSYVRENHPECEEEAQRFLGLLTSEQSGHHAIKNYNASDAFDTIAIAKFIEVQPERSASLIAEWRPITAKEHQQRVESVKALRQTLNTDVLMQKRTGYSLETDGMEVAKELLPELYARLTERQKELLQLRLVYAGKANERVDVNWSRYFPLFSTLIKSNGEPRLRPDVKQLPFWKYVRRYLLGMHASHLKAGVVAASVKHDSRPAMSVFRLPKVLNEATGKMKQPQATYQNKVPAELRPAFRQARAEVDRELRGIWNVMRDLVISRYELT